MNHVRSVFCETAGEEAHIGEQHPGSGAGGGCLEIFGKAATAAEPGESALHHPAPRQQLKTLNAGWTLDDLDGPWSAIGDRGEQLFAAVDAVGEDMVELGKGLPQRAQQRHRTVRVL